MLLAPGGFGRVGGDVQMDLVVIDEIDTDHWGIGGMPVSERRKGATP